MFPILLQKGSDENGPYEKNCSFWDIKLLEKDLKKLPKSLPTTRKAPAWDMKLLKKDAKAPTKGPLRLRELKCLYMS